MNSIKKIRFFALQATLFVACISMMFAACGEGNVNPDDNETHIHTYGTRVLRESTCKDEGEVLYFCLGCNESYCSSLPVSDHKFTDTQKEATCTEEGYLLQTCIVCDMQKKTVNERKKAHVFQEETYTQEDGSIIKKETCTLCGFSNKEVVPPSTSDTHKHCYEKKSENGATCTQEGLIRYVCKECGDSYIETVSKISHQYVEYVTRQATCEQEGQKTYTCTVCQKTYSEPIEKIAHTYQATVTKQATCTEIGEENFRCSGCGEQYTKEIEKTPHEYVKLSSSDYSKCEGGEIKWRCNVCKDRKNEKIQGVGHSYQDGVCTVCNEKQPTNEFNMISLLDESGDVVTLTVSLLGVVNVQAFTIRIIYNDDLLVFDGCKSVSSLYCTYNNKNGEIVIAADSSDNLTSPTDVLSVSFECIGHGTAVLSIEVLDASRSRKDGIPEQTNAIGSTVSVEIK